MDARRPKVSVLISCFNLGRYLDEAVESVLAQTCQDFEILVVDDGSTDTETQSVLAHFDRPKTRVLQMAHGGIAAARNFAVANSTGDYVCIFDADDRLEPEFLAKTTAILDRDPSVAFVSTWLRTFGDETWEWKPERCDLPTLLWEDTALTASPVRRDAVLAVGGFDTAMPEQGDDDWDFWLTLVARGYRGVIVPEVLFNYRRRPGSISTHCWHGAGHLPLAAYRFAKHEETYREHLSAVFLHQDEETAALLRRNDELERYITSELESIVALRREELARLRGRLETVASGDALLAQSRADAAAEKERARRLEEALQAATAENIALRKSWSWRITSPLRDAYGWWLRARQRP
jgi:glycosyltransferase involved in cell wall biosynthesis